MGDPWQCRASSMLVWQSASPRRHCRRPFSTSTASAGARLAPPALRDGQLKHVRQLEHGACVVLRHAAKHDHLVWGKLRKPCAREHSRRQRWNAATAAAATCTSSDKLCSQFVTLTLSQSTQWYVHSRSSEDTLESERSSITMKQQVAATQPRTHRAAHKTCSINQARERCCC